MTPPPACIEPPRLRALLEGALPEGEQAELNRHLESCERCQQTLERLVAGQGSWSSLPRYFGAAAPASETPADAGVPLPFLSASDQPGSVSRLGPYEVGGVIGRGGMGVVYKALDPRLQRVVAIKVLAPHLAASAAARRRFVREARAAAAVRDEHVIKVHDVDEANGVPYLVMEYVAGGSLQDRLDRTGPLQVKEVLRLGMQTAAGLAAAHAQGLVHRDVKPANILLEDGVERVKLTDFGLARAIDDASLSESGVVAGTPPYMAPEQAQGEAVDHRADLFSLGSVLYALCAGRPPFRAGNPLAILKRVCEDTPRPLREVNSEVPDGLAALIARLHAKDPAHRFASAAQVAALLSEHLARLQQAEAPPPLPPAAGPRRRRWLLAVAAAAGGLVGLGLLAAPGATRLAATLRRAPHVASEKPEEAKAPPSDPLDQLDPAAIPAVERFAGQPRELVAVLGEHAGLHWDEIRAAACSPDGKLVASAGVDGLIVLADADTLRPRAVLSGHTGLVYSVAFAPDSRRLISGGGDGTVRVWDSATGRERLQLARPGGGVNSVRFSPDGRQAVAAGDAGLLYVCDADSGLRRQQFRGHQGYVAAAAFSPDGRRVVSGGADHTARVWDLESGKELRCFRGHPGVVRGVAFLPDGRHVLSAGGRQFRNRQYFPAPDYDLRLWDVDTGQEERRLAGHQDAVLGMDLSADGRRALTAGQDGTVRLWDVEAGRERSCLRGHRGQVWCVALAADGRRAFSGGEDKVVRWWDLAAGKELPPPAGYRGPACTLAFSPDGGRLLSGGWEDRAVRLWDVVSGKELPPFVGHTLGVWCVTFSPDGRLALSGSADRTLRVWDVATRREIHKCEGHAGWVCCVAVAPDGRRALTGGWSNGDDTVRCWDLDGGTERFRFQPPQGAHTVAFAPDGRRALTGGLDKTVRLWDLDSRQAIQSFEGHTEMVSSVAVAPDGRQAASCGSDRAVWLWPLDDPGRPARRLLPRDPDMRLRGVTFAPDGKTLASCGWGGQVILWDVAEGKQVRQWQFPGWVNGIAFTPVGRHLAVANGNGTIYILRLTSAAEGSAAPGG
jgi:WD40 repeat protein